MELHRSLSARSGLTPPPRFLSMKDTHGNEVMSELSGSLDFDQDIIDLRTAGTVATDEDGAKLRVHTDGYKIKLASKFATN